MHNPSRNCFFLTLFVTFLLIFLAGCGLENETPTPTAALAAATETPQPATDTPSPTPTTPPPTETLSPLPTETPEPTATPTQTALEQAQSATVRIVVEGSEYLETLIGGGTGIIYDSSGLVLTANHLVEGAGLVQVSIEGTEGSLSAEIIGRSACDNLAVLKLLGTDFPAVSLSETDALGAGVQVIGYPIGETTQNKEESAIEEEPPLISAGFADITGTLPLDVALDPGYSGAPVLTGDGQLTGLIVYPGSEMANAAVLPLSYMTLVVAQLEQGNNLNWIGLNTGPLTAESAEQIGIEPGSGLFVYAVDFRGSAGQADAQYGDIITEIGGVDVTNEDGLEQYCSVLRNNQEGEVLDIVVLRNGSRYLGQINGEPLAEEVVVVETPPEETTEAQPSANSPKSALLAIIQSTDFDMRSIVGTIDSILASGCLNNPHLTASYNQGSSKANPTVLGPTAETEAHPAPGCAHTVSDCQSIVDRHARITNPPAVDLSSAGQELLQANEILQTSLSVYLDKGRPLVEACQSFVLDSNQSIPTNSFGNARQGIAEALNILAPAFQLLQDS